MDAVLLPAFVVECSLSSPGVDVEAIHGADCSGGTP